MPAKYFTDVTASDDFGVTWNIDIGEYSDGIGIVLDLCSIGRYWWPP